MSDDHRNNPFRHLAKRLFAEENKSGSGGTDSTRPDPNTLGPSKPGSDKPGPDKLGPDKPCPDAPLGQGKTRAAPVPHGKKQTAAAPSLDDGEDAALFLDAVSHIQPLRHKENKKHRSGGHSLADSMRALKERPARPASINREKTARASTKPVPPAKESEAASFGAAMRQLFASSAPALDTAGAPGRPNRPDALDASAESSPAREEENELFAKAVAGTRPLNDKGRALAPAARQKQQLPAVDPARALREILEGRLEFALHHTDEYMEGFVVGLDPLVLARLRAGRYSPEKHLDLHGLNSRQAFEALTHFLKDAYQRNMRCVVVVTGRGRNSPDGVGVLRPSLQNWLSRDPFKRVVLAFCTAKAGDGGPGAVYVLLRKYKKSRGKIIWERGHADDDFPDL